METSMMDSGWMEPRMVGEFTFNLVQGPTTVVSGNKEKEMDMEF